MREGLLKHLINKYPLMFRSMNLPTSGLIHGIECEDGWFNIIDIMCEKGEKHLVELYNKIEGKADRLPSIEQIREKFGRLRIYMTYWTDPLLDIVEEAEKESGVTCEICGEPGELFVDYGVSKILCENHKEEAIKKQEAMLTGEKVKEKKFRK